MIQNWDKLEYDFGNVPSKMRLNASFNYLSTKKIRDIKSSCSCVSTRFRNGILVVDWEFKNKKDAYQSYKYVTVTYEDRTFDVLKLTAFINGQA